jgi:hypothetical protein
MGKRGPKRGQYMGIRRNPTGKGGFKKGASGNPGGIQKLPENTEEMRKGIYDELYTLARRATAERVRLEACRELLDRFDGKPVGAAETQTAPVKTYLTIVAAEAAPQLDHNQKLIDVTPSKGGT